MPAWEALRITSTGSFAKKAAGATPDPAKQTMALDRLVDRGVNSNLARHISHPGPQHTSTSYGRLSYHLIITDDSFS